MAPLSTITSERNNLEYSLSSVFWAYSNLGLTLNTILSTFPKARSWNTDCNFNTYKALVNCTDGGVLGRIRISQLEWGGSNSCGHLKTKNIPLLLLLRHPLGHRPSLSKLGSGHIHILACKKGKERKSCISNGKSASNSERTVMNLRRIQSLLLVGLCA